MQRLLLFLTLSCLAPSALCQQSLPEQPLQPNELRQILAQLYELRALRGQVAAYDAYVMRDQEQDARERAAYERALELERQATALAVRETAVERQRADLYEGLYMALTKKRGWTCTLKRIFTLGLGRCQ